MKQLILTFLLIVLYSQNIKSVTQIKIGNENLYNLKLTPKFQFGIKDGWYEAIVKYDNYSTGTHATYRLNVRVEFNSITMIDFGNGGSVHSGLNNEGYLYTGGYLSFEKDYEGNIISATANVTISDKDGLKYFKIRIE